MLEINITTAVLTFIIALFIQAHVTRRHLSGILDPLTYFIVTSSFAVTLAATLVNDAYIFSRVAIYLFFFWLGFFITSPSSKNRDTTKTEHRIRKDASFSIIITTGVLLVITANIFAWQRAGVPLFSIDPSLQKSESLKDGLGIVRRLNWGLGTFLFMGSVFWILFNQSKIAVTYLTSLALVAILNGSKSALLPIVFAIGLFLKNPFLNNKLNSIKEHTRSLSRYTLIIAAVPVLAVFLIESDDITEAAIALGTRLLYFGDALLYWSDSELRQHFKSIHPPHSYPMHLFGGILGATRLVPYSAPIGNDFVQFSLRVGQELSDSLGPNVPFYVKGEIFFGTVFAAAYSTIIGMAIAFFRRIFSQREYSNLTSYTIAATLAGLSMTLPVEDSLMINRIFDFALFLTPTIIFSRILIWSTRRLTPNSNDYS
ncbi:hypothetical protein [Hydrogenophaga sp.]|uniref:hypothetical protein n=1 Tax=Hydrogenophaga sp. TaxID=1904254 RepID=UPI00286E67FE|nr:hypothetical protein [Hydrogenophaga sp.]